MKCVHCHQSFKHHDELIEHLRAVHMGAANKEARTCVSCGKTTAELEQHMRDTHLPEQRVFRCRVCSRQFKMPGSRNRHEFDDHTELECDAVDFTRLA